jgi:hypothetical protein
MLIKVIEACAPQSERYPPVTLQWITLVRRSRSAALLVGSTSCRSSNTNSSSPCCRERRCRFPAAPARWGLRHGPMLAARTDRRVTPQLDHLTLPDPPLVAPAKYRAAASASGGSDLDHLVGRLAVATAPDRLRARPALAIAPLRVLSATEGFGLGPCDGGTDEVVEVFGGGRCAASSASRAALRSSSRVTVACRCRACLRAAEGIRSTRTFLSRVSSVARAMGCAAYHQPTAGADSVHPTNRAGASTGQPAARAVSTDRTRQGEQVRMGLPYRFGSLSTNILNATHTASSQPRLATWIPRTRAGRSVVHASRPAPSPRGSRSGSRPGSRRRRA